MSLKTEYLRLFGLLALMLPLYGGVQLWLLSEPATRTEVLVVPEPVTIRVPVEVEVPIERVIFVPVPVENETASAEDRTGPLQVEEPGSTVPLLLAIPSGFSVAEPEPTVRQENGAPAAAAPNAAEDVATQPAGRESPAAEVPRARARPPTPPIIPSSDPVLTAPVGPPPVAGPAPPAPTTPLVFVVARTVIAPPILSAAPIVPVAASSFIAAAPTQVEEPKRVQPADADDKEGEPAKPTKKPDRKKRAAEPEPKVQDDGGRKDEDREDDGGRKRKVELDHKNDGDRKDELDRRNDGDRKTETASVGQDSREARGTKNIDGPGIASLPARPEPPRPTATAPDRRDDGPRVATVTPSRVDVPKPAGDNGRNAEGSGGPPPAARAGGPPPAAAPASRPTVAAGPVGKQADARAPSSGDRAGAKTANARGRGR